mgnify:CR=1 FL=1
MKKLIALILVIVCVALFYQGHQRRKSLVGASEAAGQKALTAIDGQTRVSDYLWYEIGGAACAAVGGVTLLRKKR